MKIPENSAIYPYAPACVLRASGPDAATFLQGQFTNDLSKAGPGQAVYGLWLDRKGKVIGDSHVIQAPDGQGYTIISMGSPAEAIRSHLGDHIIADEVEILDETPAWRGIVLLGTGTGAWLAAAPRAGLFFPGRRESGENWEWILPEVDAAGALGLLAGARVAGGAEVERRRILSGIPSVPADIGPSDLPNEGGLDLQAISYSKGCYLGQEVMARIKSLGRVRRRLVRVSGSGTVPPLPSGLWLGERREGEIRSATGDPAGFAGLALLSVTSLEAGGPFSLAPNGVPSVKIS
jgi:folate-binding protein YgfZ